MPNSFTGPSVNFVDRLATKYRTMGKNKDVNLPDENPKRVKAKPKGFMDRFVSKQDPNTQSAINKMRDLATKK